MTENDMIFLGALKASLRNEKTDIASKLTADGFIKLFNTAELHNVFPLIYNAVYGSAAGADSDVKRIFSIYKNIALSSVMTQTRRTAEFLSLYSEIADAGTEPVVVKGIVCRNLYPQPDYRLSSDEDMYVGAHDYEKCRRTVEEAGMRCDSDNGCECKYLSRNGSFCVEIGTMLFAHSLEAFDRFNPYFPKAEDCSEYITQGKVRIRTLEPTDHFFFLICHALKHFIHCGFGIRQICDMMLFAEAYGSRIDWERIAVQCREISAEKFTQAVFAVCTKYLGFDCEKACIPEEMTDTDIDELPLLDDILNGGVFGKSDTNRLHSANITMNAVTSDDGTRKSSHVFRSIFPSVKQMERDAPYLREKPYLLPAAWLKRIARYSRKTVREGRLTDAAEAVRIGSRRVELLKMYGIK